MYGTEIEYIYTHLNYIHKAFLTRVVWVALVGTYTFIWICRIHKRHTPCGFYCAPRHLWFFQHQRRDAFITKESCNNKKKSSRNDKSSYYYEGKNIFRHLYVKYHIIHLIHYMFGYYVMCVLVYIPIHIHATLYPNTQYEAKRCSHIVAYA